MLIESKLLNREQLTSALAGQKKAGLRLGQYLIRQGTVSENQIVDLLSRQLKIPKYHPEQYPLEMGLSMMLPADAAQKYQVAPLRKKGRLLTLAMTDPLDINVMDAIEVMTNAEVEPVVCTEREVTQLITGIYGSQSGLGSLIESIDFDTQQEADKAEDAPEEVQVSSLQDLAGEAPVIRLVNSIFAQAIREGQTTSICTPSKKRPGAFPDRRELHDCLSPKALLCCHSPRG